MDFVEARGRFMEASPGSSARDDAVRRGTPALTASANDESGPALRKLGFEKVLGFRRLEDVLSSG